MSNITPMPPTNRVAQAENQLLQDIKDAVYKQVGVITVAQAIGVLRIAEIEIYNEQD